MRTGEYRAGMLVASGWTLKQVGGRYEPICIRQHAEVHDDGGVFGCHAAGPPPFCSPPTAVCSY